MISSLKRELYDTLSDVQSADELLVIVKNLLDIRYTEVQELRSVDDTKDITIAELRSRVSDMHKELSHFARKFVLAKGDLHSALDREEELMERVCGVLEEASLEIVF